jgi:hypothetical protein
MLGILRAAKFFGITPFDQLDTDVVITPMVFFGCAYYPWSALDNFQFSKRLF